MPYLYLSHGTSNNWFQETPYLDIIDSKEKTQSYTLQIPPVIQHSHVQLTMAMDDFPNISMAIFHGKLRPCSAASHWSWACSGEPSFFEGSGGGCNQQCGDEMGASWRYNNLMGD